MRFDKDVALVTGGGTGIGREIALLLAREGAQVAICDVDTTGIDATVTDLQGVSDRGALGLRCNVANAAEVDEAVGQCIRHFGFVSILVNNAGITRDGIVPKMDEAMWDAVLDVNLKGVFNCSRFVLPAMKERRRGRIVSISSRSSFGNYGQANYASSKGGIVGFTRALALEAGPYGIRVNAVAPGYIDSPMTRGTIGDRVEQIKAASALRAIGRPSDVASVVAFLASEEANYVTGQTLSVGGGRSIGQQLL